MSLLKQSNAQCRQLAEHLPYSLHRAVRAVVMQEANRAVANTKRLGKPMNRKYFQLWYHFPEA